MVISLPVFFAFSITGSFQCDAALKWNKKCMTLPISAKNVVFARYLTFAILMGIGALFSFVFGVVYMNITNFSQTNHHFTLQLGMAIALLMPLFYASLFFQVFIIIKEKTGNGDAYVYDFDVFNLWWWCFDY